MISFFIGDKILASFNFIAKVSTNRWSEMKLKEMCKADTTKVVHYLRHC